MARTGERRTALHELILRHREWVNHYAARRVRGTGIGRIDVEDAQQDAVLGVLRAITRYDLHQAGRPRRCSFRTFLAVVIQAHVSNFIKRQLRAEARYDRSFPAADLLDAGVLGDRRVRGKTPLWGREADDPAHAVQRQEARARLDEVLDRLEERQRRLWDRLAAGARLAVVAAELGVSYHAAKRRRRGLIRVLRTRLGDLVE